MNRFLLSAAALALLAAPAFAQRDEHGGGHPGGGGGHEHGGGAPAAPAAAPAAPAMHPVGGGVMRAGPGGNRHDAGAMHAGPTAPGAAAPAAPNVAPARQHDNRADFNRGNDHHGDFNRGNDNRGARPDARDGRGSDNRSGGPDNRFGQGNRPGTPGFAGRPANAPRPDFNHFRDYHRSFNASRRFHAPAYRRPSGWYYRRWTFGEFLPSLFWGAQFWLNDYMDYDLPPPPPGTVWVRYGDDALLIDRYTGEIITVEYGVFY